jgi:aspartyl-tRNA(Asn)/glutamyl-tRNA(Gln) amidotransferase subunit A
VALRDTFNAFISLVEEPAAGIRLGVKDLFDTAGLRTTYGSAIFREHVPTESAQAVRRLEENGYVVVGKTNLHEFAYGITSENEHYGDVVNPLDSGRIPGGSSGGSAAALAAGLCDVALGTDSAGSIRLPAACCGIVGFKPTYDLVSTHGVFPLAPSFDHAGPMARTVAECTRATEGLVPGFETLPLESPEQIRVGVAWLERAEPLVRERVKTAASVFPDRVEIPFPLVERFSPAFMREVAEVHVELFAKHADLYGKTVRTKVERCLRVSDADAAASSEAREAYRADALEALEGLDLLLVPTMAFVAPRVGIGDLALREGVIRLTWPFNGLGWPALALPAGPAEDGLPASVSVVGRPGDDALVLAAGEALQASL